MAIPYQVADQSVVEELERFGQDAQYFQEHREELLARYPDRWVAVYHQQVVGAAKRQPRLIAQLERKSIPPGRVYREYLSTKEELWILPADAP